MSMKLFLAILLCGVTCCFAVPECSKEEIQKCSAEIGDDDVEEEKLKSYCSSVQCWVDAFNRCGNSQFGPYFPHKDFQKIVSTLCVHGNPMQRMYYDNIKCIGSVLQGNEDDFPVEFNCLSNEEAKEEKCRKLSDTSRCISKYVVKSCGKDAGDVFESTVAPVLVSTLSDCIPAFEIEIIE